MIWSSAIQRPSRALVVVDPEPSSAISMTSPNRVFSVLRKPSISRRRVINAAPREQTICRVDSERPRTSSSTALVEPER